MSIIKSSNIRVSRYGRNSYKAEIINRGCNKRNLAVGIFELDDIKQWQQVVVAFEAQIKMIGVD
jgi:hypothetical protein